MNPLDAFAVGIAPDHLPALVAALALPIVVLMGRRLRANPAPVAQPVGATPGQGPIGTTPGSTAGPVRAWTAWLLGLSAAVHLALPLGHADGLVLTLGLLGCGAGFAWFAVRAWQGRSYRLGASLLLVATLAGYLIVTGVAGEEPDQVGIATALVELAALGLCLVPVAEPGRRRRFARLVSSLTVVLTTLLVGVIVWAQFFVAHTGAPDQADPTRATVGHTGRADANDGKTDARDGHEDAHEDGHDGHAHAARAQAGVVMRPPAGGEPTPAQRRAADELAAATAAAVSRYASLDAALAAGYAPSTKGDGMDVHLENRAFGRDGRTLDPDRPEQLVYAIEGGRATLLGVVYVMERAGVAAPEPGGPITQWHAHNLCLTLLPPGFGAVSPFGSCPALSLSVTTAEMMHVWVVDNPGGAFAEGLDAAWVRAYHAVHGQPVSRR
ncbi:MAG TPA: hypothetical protein VF163_03325 [Micromonosporaceae bacterium]